MSIVGEIYAEFGEKKRKEWLSKLKAARAAQDWSMVDDLIAEMDRYYFSD